MRPAPDETRFSVGIALVAWFCAFVASAVGAAAVLALTGYLAKDVGDYPLWLVAVLQLPLWLGQIGALVVVSRWFGTGKPQRDYGLSFSAVDFVGLPIGLVAQLVFVPALYWLLSPIIDPDKVGEAAENLTNKADDTLGVVLLVVLVVVGAPIVEELFFRGLVMRSFQARYNDGLALFASAALFGLAHFNLYTLPALALFGLVLGYCAQRTGRLGMSIMAHAGFNAATVALLLR
ncbi:MAG TPA: type II CAAX endopeptidase family protein [Acidimicrobiales bacterium]